MKLYEFGATRSLRVRWTLQEIGAPFESIVVNLTQGAHREPAYLKLNPAGKLPTLIDGDLVLTESAAIVLYLAEKHPEKRLLPERLEARAEHNRWLMFTVTELEQPLWRIARHTFIYPEEQRLEADAAIARREFRQMAAVIESHMRGRDFVAGDRVTVADFVLAYTLDWANEEALLDEAPTLLTYMERMYQRPNAPPRIAQAMAAASGG